MVSSIYLLKESFQVEIPSGSLPLKWYTKSNPTFTKCVLVKTNRANPVRIMEQIIILLSSTSMKDIYEVMGVPKEASQKDIKRAYYRLALKLHPDRNSSSDAKDRFQELQKIYGILSDEHTRKIYDRTGDVDGLDLDLGEWEAFFKEYLPEVSERTIEEFFENYAGSEEEWTDIDQKYKQFKGDMKEVLKWVIWSESVEDELRINGLIKAAIKDGTLESFPLFEEWAKTMEKRSKRVKKKKRGRDRDENDDSISNSNLASLIRSRRNDTSSAHSFPSLLGSLAEKYGEELGEEPSEEAFQEARARLERKKTSQRTVKKVRNNKNN